MYKQRAKDKLYCPRLGQYLQSGGSITFIFDPNVAQGPLGKAQVEAFLDDHPDFMESYVLRKVDRFVEI